MNQNEVNDLLPSWAPLPDMNNQALLTMGCSFLVGLAMGTALKLALRITLVLSGIALLAIFALQYSGLLQVNWGALEWRAMSVFDKLVFSGNSFVVFVRANLSNAIGFTVGLIGGLRGR